jgi:DNA-binding transcriptional ArsR family regulator
MTDQGSILTALADPTRRAIFERVARRPGAVGELAQEFPVSRPAVSQHLKVLRDAGLVRQDSVGTRRIYSVDLTGLAVVREYFEQFWQMSLGAFREAANRSHKEET